MTIITKGMGAVIKKFGKKTATHMQKQATRHKAWTKMGLKGPKYKIGKKVKGSHRLDEVWTYDKNYKEKAKGGRIGLQAGGPPSIDKEKIAKEKLREQYYKKHGRPGEFEKKAREARAKLDTRKTLAVSDPHKRTRHSVYSLRKKGGKV